MIPFCRAFSQLKNYDANFGFKHFRKRYAKHMRGQKVTYDDVEVIPLNGERFFYNFR